MNFEAAAFKFSTPHSTFGRTDGRGWRDRLGMRKPHGTRLAARRFLLFFSQ
jgi:hypothetical protein